MITRLITVGPLSKMATTYYLPEMDRDRQQAEEETDCLFAENQIVRVRRMLCLGALASYGNDCHWAGEILRPLKQGNMHVFGGWGGQFIYSSSYICCTLFGSVCSNCDKPPLLIPLKKLKSTGVEIGQGAYGRVFEVEYENTRYAAKEIHPLLLEAAQGKALENIKDNFLNECHIWSLLQHSRIVQIIGLLIAIISCSCVIPIIVHYSLYNYS